MRKTGLLILLVAALIGCPPPGEDEIFNNINIADWVTFADGDSISSVTQSFTVAAEKDGYTATVKAPSTMTVEGNTVSVNPINIYAPSQEAILTITLTKDGVSKQFPLTVTLKRTLGSMPVEQLILFEESLDTIDGVTKNFTLAQDTGDWGEDISWKFDTDSANLQYNPSTGEVTVTLTDEQQKATATATFTKEGFEPVTKTYEITVLTQNEGFSWTPDSLSDYITLGNDGKDYLWRIRADFELTTEIPADDTHGAVTVSWNSSNEGAISINGGDATVTRALDSQKVTLTAAFKEESRREKSLTIDVLVMETIPNTLTVDGKTYKLVYFDAFDNQAILEANWDIGNPGHDAPEIGNNNLAPSYFKAPDGQFHGYADEWQKQPTWSPRATYIEDGKARLLAKYDKEEQIGVAGALHSKRLFPHGVFHARWTQKRDSNSHWDAFWLDTNQPFSKAYGQKLLNLPKALRSQVETTTEGFFNNQANNIQHGNTSVSNPILYQSQYTLKTDSSVPNWGFTAAKRVDKIGRWYNGEQRYELDAYEWVNGTGQNNVIHTWHWMRGYPGNQTGTQEGVDKKWYVGDVARGQGKIGGYSGTYNAAVNKTPSFTLTALYNDSKIAFYYNAHGESNFSSPKYSRSKKNDGTFDNTATTTNSNKEQIPNPDNYQPWPDDEFNPVQVKFTIEPGQWDDRFFMITTEFQNKPDEFDAMDLEYFAYYAAEDDMLNPNIGDENSGVSLTAITDMDNVQESAETQKKLTKEWVQE